MRPPPPQVQPQKAKPDPLWSRRLQAELGDQLLDGEPVVRGDRFEHAAKQRSGLQRPVIGHRDVMGSVDLGGEADMRAVLSART